MVGGTIIEVRRMLSHGSQRDVLRLWCMDRYNDECAVYTDPIEPAPRPGDKAWWQGGQIFWTDQDGAFVERPIPKVGGSFDPRPKRRSQTA